MKRRAGQYDSLLTEGRNPASKALDTMTTPEVLALMNGEDASAVAAVERELPNIARAVDLVVASFEAGGRLIYVGAGTSGRLGVIDAAECPPTFGVPRTQVQGIIAGGPKAIRRSVEGAEDSDSDGAAQIARRKVDGRDTVMGITASSTAAFVVAAMKEARRRGARTVFFCCTPTKRPRWADVLINPLVGPEVLSGSTRLKAGTATKLTLNMITTASMVRMGKAYENLMVDLRPWCAKLEFRAERILRTLLAVTPARARALMAASGNDLKTALVMGSTGATRAQARRLLAAHDGRLRDALAADAGRKETS